MRVFRHHSRIDDRARGAVVAIGNFDGIHRGHQGVIAKAARLAAEFDCPLAVMTFEPHPRTFFSRVAEPIRLTPFRLKIRLIESLGVDSLFVPRFDAALAAMSAEDFVLETLVGKPSDDGGGTGSGLGARHVVVGDNFRFGNKRKGDIETLERLGRSNGFGVTCVGRIVGPGSEPYSSTHVRAYLKAGNPTRAALLLGRYWEIAGRVRHGDKRGRDLGYPTANLRLGDMLRPAFGVYAVRAGLDEGGGIAWHAGAANIGIRPMYETAEPLLEVHLFDFSQDLYGRHLRVALVDHLRPEMAFDGVEALKTQMEEDCRRARASLAYETWDASWPASPFMAPVAETEGRSG